MNPRPPSVSSRKVLKLLFDFVIVAPLPLFVTVFLRLINAVGHGVSPIIIAHFTNALINGEKVFFWCGIYLSVSALEILTDSLNHPTQLWFSNKAILHFQTRLLKQAAQIPLLHFLDADFHDNLSRANHQFSDRVVIFFRSLLDNVHSIVTLVGVLTSVIVIGGGLWCALMLFTCFLMVLLTQKPLTSLEQKKEQSIARPRRRQETWAAHLTARDSAAEVRLFSLQSWLLKKWGKSYKTLADIEMDTLKKGLKWTGLAGLTTVLGYIGIIFIAAHASQNVAQNQTAGVFTGLVYASIALQGFLFYIASSLGTLSKQSTILRELASLVSPVPRLETEEQQQTVIASGITIEMDALSFRYPQVETHTLKHITAKIPPGKIVALVGKNGSGKTTLANLLLRLYPPHSGELTFENEHQSSPVSSAVFQNFVKYLLPVRDNVGLADIHRIQESDEIRRALRQAGSHISQDLDVWLGREFGGLDLSRGEWLRVALARGLFRKSNFIIFDEPTASIDPLAEVEIIRQLLTKHESQSIIIVSHRIGIARLCDSIMVLDEGYLVEHGTHSELMTHNRVYAKMWEAQAAWYASDLSTLITKKKGNKE